MSAPFMQLYVADYLGDTRHLSTEQHGAYLLLLMTMWRADGRLPNDDKKLARLTGCTASRWARIKSDVLAFFEVDGDELTHGRVELELKKAAEKSIKRADAGRRGGKAKSRKTKETSVANASDLPKHSSDIRSQRVEVSTSTQYDRAREDAAFGRFWSAYPRKTAKADARKAFAKAWRKLPPMDKEQILSGGLERAKAAWTDPQFIPHAATWLNGERWSDEPEPLAIRRPHDRPHHDAKFTARQDNLARHERGADLAARLYHAERG